MSRPSGSEQTRVGVAEKQDLDQKYEHEQEQEQETLSLRVKMHHQARRRTCRHLAAICIKTRGKRQVCHVIRGCFPGEETGIVDWWVTTLPQ